MYIYATYFIFDETIRILALDSFLSFLFRAFSYEYPEFVRILDGGDDVNSFILKV